MSQPSGCRGRDIGGISLRTSQPVRCRRFQRARFVVLNKK